ncbi:MAG TPA: hypothetical protein VKV73_14915 [Chloroflexota bacterium]|nr:hypothetical protein [Chloroflexota bacterium]
MPRPKTYAEVLAVIERHVDDAHRRIVRSVTDPEKGLPRFKTKSEHAQDLRGFSVLLALLVETNDEGWDADRLRQASFDRIDGPRLAEEDTRIRRRLQGIPERAPQSTPPTSGS